MAISVNTEDADSFFGWIEEGFSLLKQCGRRPYLIKENEFRVVLSFDAEHKPFIGFSRGHNPRYIRQPLPEPLPELAETIVQILKDNSTWRSASGGRVL
jgi:hypothetical protein